MNKMEFSNMVTRIRVIFPTFLPMDDDVAFEIWYDLFKGYDIKEVMPLVDNHLRTSIYPPTPADIIPKPERMGAGEAWNEVYKLILRYGVNREEEALNDMSPEVKAAVKAVGYHTICMSSETESKKMFTQAYKETKEKSYALV